MKHIENRRPPRGRTKGGAPSRPSSGGTGKRTSTPGQSHSAGRSPARPGSPPGPGSPSRRPPPHSIAEQPALVFGRWPVLEALRAGQALRVYVVAGATGETRREVEEEARERNIPVREVPRAMMEEELAGRNHQGVAAECAPYAYSTLEEIVAAAGDGTNWRGAGHLPPLLLALDSVQDPQNLGALMRTAEGAGVPGVLLPRHRAAEVTPAVVRAAAGATAHLRIAQVTNLVRTLKDLQSAGYWSVGLDMEGTVPYHKVDVDRPLVLVVGGEGQGLGRLVRQNCDYVVSLPMYGRIASLNAATAGAIVLYDMRRRQVAGAGEASTAARDSAADEPTWEEEPGDGLDAAEDGLDDDTE